MLVNEVETSMNIYVFLLPDPCLFSFIFEQSAIVKDSSISITRVTWSPDGSLIGKSPLVNIKLF